MKTPNLSISIPEPCHENWNNMQPDEKGKFCNSCNKSVFDFSNKNDTQIHDIIKQNQGQKICGRFTKTQLNRPLNIKIDFTKIPGNMSLTKTFIVAVFLVFGSVLFSCTDPQGNKIGEIEIVPPQKSKSGYKMGEALPLNVPPDSLAIQQVSVILPEDNNGNMIKGDVKIEEEIFMGKMAAIPLNINPDSILTDAPSDSTGIIPEENYLGGLVAIEEREGTNEETKDTLLITELIETSENFALPKNDLIVYPNPGKGEFTFKYELQKASEVRLDIFDGNGTLVRTFVNINGQYAGKYIIPANLNGLASGIYFASLMNNGNRITKKLIVEP